MKSRPPKPLARLASGLTLTAALAACQGPLDLDLRGRLGGPLDTSSAAVQATATRPDPDDRGVISYPGFQVAVARRGDTLADVATRVGLPSDELARFNGLRSDDLLRRGEVVALPRRVAEPGPSTGVAIAGPIRPASEVDVTTLAEAAIDRAAPTSGTSATPPIQTGLEPVRHRVARGETAFTISRRYNVSPRALAEWNGLDADFTLREGQFLMIPTAREAAAPREPRVIKPGVGSPTPVPPSAADPLPDETLAPVADAPAESARTDSPADTAPAPEPVADIGQDAVDAPDAAMVMPVDGAIIREYARGRSDGISIGASAGQPVRAAAAGSVAHVGRNDEGVEFLLVRHPDDLITVYMFVDDISVSRGDSVSRGQQIARVRPGDPTFLQFEVRDGIESVDPMSYLR